MLESFHNFQGLNFDYSFIYLFPINPIYLSFYLNNFFQLFDFFLCKKAWNRILLRKKKFKKVVIFGPQIQKKITKICVFSTLI